MYFISILCLTLTLCTKNANVSFNNCFFVFLNYLVSSPPSQIGKDIAFESGLSLLVNK